MARRRRGVGLMAKRCLIMLVSELLAAFGDPDDLTLRELRRRKRFKNLATNLGDPRVERAGVVSRRVAWEGELPDAWPDGDRDVEFNDQIVRMRIASEFPTNWR